MLARIQRLLFYYFVYELLILHLLIGPRIPFDFLLIESARCCSCTTFLFPNYEVWALHTIYKWIFTNICKNLFTRIFFLLPGLDVVIGFLLLEPLKNHLVLFSDFDKFTLPSLSI